MLHLGGQPDRRIARAVAVIAAAPFDDFKEEPAPERRAVDLEIFTATVAIIKDVSSAKGCNRMILKAKARLKIVIVICRDGQSLESCGLQLGRRLEDVVAGKSNVLKRPPHHLY